VPSTLVIYNPSAGHGRVRKQWPQVENALRASGVMFDAVETSASLDAMSLAKDVAQKYAQIVSVGGDGTLHEVVNGLLRHSEDNETIPIGLIPLGNGDDFAKMLPPEAPIGGKPLDWRLAVQVIARGQTKLFDAGRVAGDCLRPDLGTGVRYFINAMDVGFGAHAILNFSTNPKFLKGMPGYLLAVLKTLVDYPALRLRIQVDDQPPFEQATTITAVTNGRCFGSGFWVCPQAQADDGFLDLLVGDQVSRLRILQLITKFMKGAHVNEPEAHLFQARRVALESESPLVVEADGEIISSEALRLEIDLLPKRVRMIV
jgi:YegS/Rv2252/BmrU family lipid kinase